MQRAGAKNLRQFAAKCGVPYTTLRGLDQGADPKVDTACRIAEAAGLTLDWLLTGREASGPEVDPDAARLLAKLRQLSPRAQGYIEGVIDERLRQQQQQQHEEHKEVPARASPSG